MILKSAVEHGFMRNPDVSGKVSFAVNGDSLDKNNNATGDVRIFHKSMKYPKAHPTGEGKIHYLTLHFSTIRQISAVNRGI